MQTGRAIAAFLAPAAVFALCRIAGAAAPPSAHAPRRCAVSQCYDIHHLMCTGHPCGAGLPACGPHVTCDTTGRHCPCVAPPTLTPTPTPTPTPLPPQCSNRPCSGNCTIHPSCTPSPGSACPQFVILGQCQSDAAGQCACLPVQPPTPTPTTPSRNPSAPVVTSFTCNGAAQCTMSFGESFAVQLSFTDANGNAKTWLMTARRDDGVTSEVGHGSFRTPTGGATVPLQFAPFECPQGSCRQTSYVFSLVVTDTTGLNSAPADITVTVRASAP